MADRFWDKVEKRGPDECWEWQAGTNQSGYGIFRIAEKKFRAHRIVYESANKVRLKPNEYVCHSCDNPGCVNPSHLFLADHDANMQDMVAKGRSPHGESNGRAQLTAGDVIDIRRKFNSGTPIQEIAEQYPVHQRAVRRAATGKTWTRI